MSTVPFVFRREARNYRTAVTLICIYTGLLALIIAVDAAVWLTVLCALVTVPAVIDFITNPSAGIELTDTTLHWHSGRRSGSVDYAEIDHVRIDTRFDLSRRVTLILKSQKRVRLPYEAIPPTPSLEPALTAHAIRVETQNFKVF